MKKVWIILGLVIVAVGIGGFFLLNIQKNDKYGGKKVADTEKTVENDNSTDVSIQENELFTEKDNSKTNLQENEQITEEENQNTEVPTVIESTVVSNPEYPIVSQPIQEVQPPSSSTPIVESGGQEQQQTVNPDNPSQATIPTQQVTTTFYDTITGGKKEFSSESEAFNQGNIIMQNELNHVMDYNEAHPDAQIQPDINYFRVYPSMIDENGNYWYYLHFFCQSGEGNDEKLKSLYGTTKN